MKRARPPLNWSDASDPLVADVLAYCQARPPLQPSDVIAEALSRHFAHAQLGHFSDLGDRLDDVLADAVALFLDEEGELIEEALPSIIPAEARA